MQAYVGRKTIEGLRKDLRISQQNAFIGAQIVSQKIKFEDALGSMSDLDLNWVGSAEVHTLRLYYLRERTRLTLHRPYMCISSIAFNCYQAQKWFEKDSTSSMTPLLEREWTLALDGTSLFYLGRSFL